MNKVLKAAIAILSLTIIQSVLVLDSSQNIKKSILESFKDKPKKDLFKVYHTLYNKKYDLNSEEGIRRYKIFKSSLKTIEEVNSQNLSYKLGLNDFADLSNEEFTEKYAKPIPVEEIDSHMQRFLKEINFDEVADLDEKESGSIQTKESLNQQTKIDWSNKMNPPKDQTGCGSCWAFAAITGIEGNYNVNYGNSPSFSEQELVDCSIENYGCKGGFPTKALDYIILNGLAFSNDYPYKSGITGTGGACLSYKTTRNDIVESYEHCQYFRCTNSQYLSMLQRGPITVYIDADGGTESAKIFKLYESGILENMPCGKPTHAVVVIGVDSDLKGIYYTARNSWGEEWGERGNFRIRRNTIDFTCFMETFAILPKVKNIFNPVPPEPTPGCLKLYSKPALTGLVREICENTSSIKSFSTVNGFDIGKFKKVKLFYGADHCMLSYFTLETSYGSFNNENGLISLQNNIKSIIVDDHEPNSGCIVVFDSSCLTGEKLEICKDVPDLNLFNFSRKISSIKLSERVKGVSAFTKINYGGSYTTYNSDLYGMVGYWMENKIESLKLLF